MNHVPIALIEDTDSPGGEANLLDIATSLSHGWNTEDLKIIRSSAQTLKSMKSAACIKAVAKLAMLSKNSDQKQKDIAHLLYSLNPSNKLIRENSDYIVVEVPVNFRLPKIPLGYGFKGGAARIALAHVIGWETKSFRARDFDLVRFGAGTAKQDRDLAAKIMPEDFSHGHGVEVVGSLEEYFKSRDLTINEVLFAGKKVMFSRAALDDLRHRILRPSARFAKKNPELPGKLACKILRLAAEYFVAGLSCKLVDFPAVTNVSEREIELHRKRASELGAQVEQRYLELCVMKFGLRARKISFKKKTQTIQAAEPIHQAARALRPRNEFRRFRRRS